MSDEIISAFIGAVLGSLGAVLLEHWITAKREQRRADRQLVEKYLLQFQNALESLYYRLINIGEQGGRALMSEDYYRVSTLYALGSVLAFAQILLIDGVYAKLDSFRLLRQSLKRNLNEFDAALDDAKFLRYHRLSLADSVIERSEHGARVSSYLDYRRRYETDDVARSAIGPAVQFVEGLQRAGIGPLQHRLAVLLEMTVEATKVPSAR
jgi:hypothetical protein